jgi:predicted ArsR family transcriptional regulator
MLCPDKGGSVQIKDEQDKLRVLDALRHDDVMVMIGDPNTGRPLVTFSVTRNGDGLIEYEPGDLAAGILELNKVLAQLSRGQIAPANIRVTP